MLPWRRAAACLLLVLLLGILPCHHVASARPAPAAAAGLRRPPDGAAWRPSKHLQDAGRGSRLAGVAELKRYLARFGYMHPSPRAVHDDDAFDAHMEAAVKRYQSRLGLPVTGRLDSATLGRITSPRCGVADDRLSYVSDLPEQPASRFTLLDGEPRWTGPDDPLVLTYSVSPSATVDYPPPEAARAAFRSAFARWAQVIPVEFVEADGYSRRRAHIRVGFYDRDHGDGAPFDGQGRVIAHAFGPKDGRLHFDAAERWTVDVGSETAGSAMDLESVATHEIGHVLGLAHSSAPEAVMYPYINLGERKVELSADDIEGIQQLYGYNPRFGQKQDDAPSPPRRSDPSPSGSPGTSSRLAGAVSFVCVLLGMLLTRL